MHTTTVSKHTPKEIKHKYLQMSNSIPYNRKQFKLTLRQNSRVHHSLVKATFIPLSQFNWFNSLVKMGRVLYLTPRITGKNAFCLQIVQLHIPLQSYLYSVCHSVQYKLILHGFLVQMWLQNQQSGTIYSILHRHHKIRVTINPTSAKTVHICSDMVGAELHKSYGHIQR